MQLENKRILLTGAGGGIGAELAKAFAAKGARMVLLGRNADNLHALLDELNADTDCARAVVADLLDATARERAVDRARKLLGGIDLLVNNAGLLSFRPFAEEDPVLLERIMQLNTLAPMLITRRLLPDMLEQGAGRVVNIGSTFGSIGFAWFAAYSASKFGLRGFSEALRRELNGTGVGVIYVAPRAVRTRFNTGAVYRMADVVKMNMDEPSWVAARIVESITKDGKDVYLGWPEKLFVRVNAFLPRLVDGALRKQNKLMGTFAREA